MSALGRWRDVARQAVDDVGRQGWHRRRRVWQEWLRRVVRLLRVGGQRFCTRYVSASRRRMEQQAQQEHQDKRMPLGAKEMPYLDCIRNLDVAMAAGAVKRVNAGCRTRTTIV